MSKLTKILSQRTCPEKLRTGKWCGDCAEDIKESRLQIRDLVLELTDKYYEAGFKRGDKDPVYIAMVSLRQEMQEL